MNNLIFTFFLSLFVLSSVTGQNLSASDKQSAVSRKGIESPDYIFNMAFFHFNNLEYDKSIELFEKYLEIAGENEVALMQLGKIYLNLKQVDKAKTYFERALKVNSKNIDILGYLSDIAISEDKMDTSVKYLEAITELDPVNERALFTLAQIFEQKKDSRKMMIYYKKLSLATLKNSSNTRLLTRAYNKIARYYSENQDYAKAMEYYEKITELNGQDSNALFIYGELLKLNGKFSKSADVMMNLLKYNPENESILESLVESLYILGDYRTRAYLNSYIDNANQPKLIFTAMEKQFNNNTGDAKTDFNKIIKTNPNRISVRIGILNCLKQENKNSTEEIKKEAYSIVILAQKIKAYDIAIKYMGVVFDILEKENNNVHLNNDLNLPIKPEISQAREKLINEFIDAYFTHAISLENSNNIKQATAYYLNTYSLMNQLIQTYRQKYQIKEQLHFESELFKNKPLDFPDIQNKRHNDLRNLIEKKYEIMLSLNWILFKQMEKTPFDVSRYVKENISLNPEDHRGYYILGLYFNEKARLSKDDKDLYIKAKENFSKAIEYFEKYSDNKPAPANYFFYYGIATEKTGNFGEMEKNLKKAIEQDPYNSMYLNYLGYMYSLNNENLEQAFEYIKGALEDEPENAAYLDTLGWIYFKMERFEEALGQLLVAKSLSEKSNIVDPVISFHIAETYLKLGKNSQSLFFYKSALENISKSSEPLDTKHIEAKINELSR
jgi:tetratricopeptide (TPR) repeat protein